MILVGAAFVICLVVSAVAVFAAFYALSGIIIELFASALWSRFGIPLILLSVICLVGFLTPFVIFPAAAYFLSPSIYVLQYEEKTTFGILLFFAGFPYFFLPVPIIYLMRSYIRNNAA